MNEISHSIRRRIDERLKQGLPCHRIILDKASYEQLIKELEADRNWVGLMGITVAWGLSVHITDQPEWLEVQ